MRIVSQVYTYQSSVEVRDGASHHAEPLAVINLSAEALSLSTGERHALGVAVAEKLKEIFDKQGMENVTVVTTR